VRRAWNPDETKQAHDLGLWLVRFVQRIPILNPRPVAKAATLLSGPLGPVTSLAGQMFLPTAPTALPDEEGPILP
jgi:hypothetical protein